MSCCMNFFRAVLRCKFRDSAKKTLMWHFGCARLVVGASAHAGCIKLRSSACEVHHPTYLSLLFYQKRWKIFACLNARSYQLYIMARVSPRTKTVIVPFDIGSKEMRKRAIRAPTEPQ
jgi:hypothetical protein